MTIATNERSLGIVNLKSTSFYLCMSVSAAAIAFLGFAPTYWGPLLSGTVKGPPVIHLHAAVFFSWTLFVVLQTWLAASRSIAWHRAAGMAGISLATAMTIAGFLVAITMMGRFAASGQRNAGEAFAIVPIASVVFFAITFILAVANVQRSEWHKRLMLLATVSILDAPIARWFMLFMAPPDASGPPPAGVDILPSVVVALLIVIAIIYDRRTRGRPHAIYLAGGLAFVAVKVLQVPMSETGLWHAVAGWLLGLAG